MKKVQKAKTKIKRIKLPLNKMTGNEKDYVAVILEEMRSDFRAFGEGLTFVRDDVRLFKEDFLSFKEETRANFSAMGAKLDSTFEEVGNIKVEMSEMKMEMKEMNHHIANVEAEVSAIRHDIDWLKTTLTQKSDIEYVKKLEKRVERMEAYLKLSVA